MLIYESQKNLIQENKEAFNEYEKLAKQGNSKA